MKAFNSDRVFAKDFMSLGLGSASQNFPCAKNLAGTFGLCTVESLEPRRLFSSSLGVIDDNFGVSGHAYAPITTAGSTAGTGQVIVGNNGDIYAAGSAGIAQFSAAGVQNEAYGTNGLAAPPSAGLYDRAVDSNGLLYGLTSTGTVTELIRYTAAGVRDQSYGNGGAVLINSQLSVSVYGETFGLTVQPDDKVVVAYAMNAQTLVVLRFNSDGSPDNAFANAGEFQDENFEGFPTSNLRQGEYAFASVTGCSVMANGDILVGGGSYVQNPTSTDDTEAQLYVARLTPAGILDSTYGTNGISNLVFVNTFPFPDVTNPATLIPTIFAANPYGVATVCLPNSLYGEQVGLFTSSGNATLLDDLPGEGAPTGVAILSDGQAIFSQGASLTVINSAGTIIATTVVDSFEPASINQIGATQSVAMAADGDLLAIGAPASGSGSELSAFSLSTPEELPNGTINTVTASPDGSLDLAYHNSASNDLEFVDRLPDEQWNEPITVDSSAGAGDFVSIATDPASSSLIEIAYYDQSAHSLKLATSTNAGASFTTQTIDATGNVGESPSIYINHLGLASIAFYNQTEHHLLLASENRSGRWVISTIDASGNVGTDAALVPSPSGQLSVAYSDKTRGWLKWAEQNPNGTWQINKAAVAPDGAQGISMAYGTGDVPLIAFFDIARRQLRVTELSGATGGHFSTGNITRGLEDSTGIAITSGPYPITYVYSEDAAGNAIQRSESYSGVYYLRNIFETGGQYLSLADDDGVEVAAHLDSNTGDLTVSSFAG